MIFRGARFQFEFPGRALIMGVVNVTPDSFSDGGEFYDSERAVDHAFQLIAEGADIVDIGGESTRPRAAIVSESEELRRVLPVIDRLRGKAEVPLSIDTQKPAVAREALQAGAAIINDVAANRLECEMWEIAAQSGAGYILMHMQGTPQTMHLAPTYGNIVAEVDEFFRDRLDRAQKSGMRAEQVLLDPGIGFGKTAEHNLQLLAGLARFTVHERPLLLGVSRKSFIGKLLGGEVKERLPGSLACAVWAVLNGVRVIRTHDVAATIQAVRMIEEIERVSD